MFVERRGQVIRVPITLVNWQQEEPTDRGEGRQLFMDDTSRVSREAQARFCERPGVRFPGATRPTIEMSARGTVRRSWRYDRGLALPAFRGLPFTVRVGRFLRFSEAGLDRISRSFRKPQFQSHLKPIREAFGDMRAVDVSP